MKFLLITLIILIVGACNTTRTMTITALKTAPVRWRGDIILDAGNDSAIIRNATVNATNKLTFNSKLVVLHNADITAREIVFTKKVEQVFITGNANVMCKVLLFEAGGNIKIGLLGAKPAELLVQYARRFPTNGREIELNKLEDLKVTFAGKK